MDKTQPTTINIYGQYVDVGYGVFNTDEIANLFREVNTIQITLKGNPTRLDSRFPDAESTESVWRALTDTLRKYSR